VRGLLLQDGDTALHLAASSARGKVIVGLLLAAGAAVDGANEVRLHQDLAS
jgi:hypothetical protein